MKFLAMVKAISISHKLFLPHSVVVVMTCFASILRSKLQEAAWISEKNMLACCRISQSLVPYTVVACPRQTSPSSITNQATVTLQNSFTNLFTSLLSQQIIFGLFQF